MKQIILHVRVNEGEKALIEKMAKKDGMSLSDYIRSAIYFEMVMSGSPEALRLLGGRLKDKLARRLSKAASSEATSS